MLACLALSCARGKIDPPGGGPGGSGGGAGTNDNGGQGGTGSGSGDGSGGMAGLGGEDSGGPAGAGGSGSGADDLDAAVPSPDAPPFSPPSDGPSPPAPASCACVPGKLRWCGATITGSKWGRQTCLSDGQWGACTEAADLPPGGCDPLRYDPCCCIRAGACCERSTTHESLGDCDGISCGTERKLPPGLACECSAGAERWCNPGATSSCSVWGKQTCGSDGRWRSCKVVPERPAGCSKFASFDSCCCLSSGSCCQVQDYGIKTTSLSQGACGGLTCPPKTTCPGAGACVPGAERFCTPTTSGTPEWGKQACLPGGDWGPCSTKVAPLPGCDLGSAPYSPICCASSGFCCEVPRTCGASIGHCDGIACR